MAHSQKTSKSKPPNVHSRSDAPSILVTLDSKGKILRVTESFLKISGFKPSDLISNPDYFFTNTRFSDFELGQILEELEASRIWKGVLTQKADDGIVSSINATLVPVPNNEGELEKIVVYGDVPREITAPGNRYVSEKDIYEATFKQMAVGVAHVGTDGEWIRVNQKVCEILGFTTDEFAGRTFQEITHPDDLEEDLRLVGKMLAGKIDDYSMEKRYIRKDGSTIWCRLTVSAIKDPDNKTRFFISIIEDISAQKTAENDLKIREQRFKQIAESLPQLVWTCDNDGECDYLSPQWVTYTGIPEKEQLGFGWLEQIHPNDRDETVKEWEISYQTKTNLDVEFRIRRHDGVYRWHKTRALPLLDAEGNVSKWFGTNTDIEASKQDQSALESKKDYLAKIIDSLFVYVFVTDTDGKLESTNDISVKAIESNFENKVGKEIWNCKWWNFDESVASSIKEACESSVKGAPVHFDTIMRSYGENIAVELHIAPLKDTDGKVTNLLATAIDVSDRVRVKKLEEYALKLKNSNEELEQFAHIASHDLQEPLRMVASYIEMFGNRYSGKLDERADRYINYILQGAWRMQDLINDLLAFSRIGFTNDDFHKINTESVLKDTIDNLDSVIKETNTEIVFGNLPEIVSNEVHLSQLFQNLIGNAIKFRSEEPPRIEISVDQNETEWLFSVKDNGIGIDEKYTERIFQMFSRLHDRTKFDGSGIGLAISRKIVELHGGVIMVESKPGEGSNFKFTIPKVIPKSVSRGLEND